MPAGGSADPERIGHIRRTGIFASYFKRWFLHPHYPISKLWDEEDCEDIEFYYIASPDEVTLVLRWRCYAYKNKWFETSYNGSSWFAAFMCELDDGDDYNASDCSCCSLEEEA